jgi:L-fuconolactonase
MMKIDAHQHYWAYNANDYGWMGPGMEILKKNHLPDHLQPLLEKTGIDGTVAVQARQIVEETRWLLELAGQYPFIKGVVGWVDLRSPQLDEQLTLFKAQPKFCGVRHVIHDEPDDAFMLQDDFIRGIGMLAEFDLTYDLLLFPKHLPAACELVSKFPAQPFVVDHLAKPLIKDGIREPWATDLRRLAENPNVYCKVSGMVTEADWHAWQPADFQPYLDIVFEAFGLERVMLGSDWPVCTVAGSYADIVGIIVDYIQQFSADEQAGIMGKNAMKFYGLK